MEKSKARPGDYVEIILSTKSYKGYFLESSELDKKIILIKLDTGYNIGISKKDIVDIRILKKFQEKIIEKEISRDNKKPNIGMIITGGTIASSYDVKTGGVAPLVKPADLFRFYPELFEKVNVSIIEIPFMKASEDMDFKDWQKIARTAEKLLRNPNIKGIIITHGTDTLHYTSAALSFFLKNLNKPVVLTYSQRSIDRASSDANLNLQCSALAAISDIAEVMLVGHATINDDYCYAMPGTKVKKMHTSKRDAFKIVNGKPFAKIYPERIEIISNYRLRNNNRVKADVKFEDKIALVKIYPGQNPDILDYYVRKKYKGIVLEVTGLGHVPAKQARKSWLKKLKEIQKKNILICAASQTIYGRLDPLVYSNGRELLKAGILFLEDMLAETALVKLGYVLARTKNKEEARKLMLTNLAGEFSERLEN